MSETYVFVILTTLLVSLGLIMPFVNEFATGEETINDVEGLSGIADSGLGLLDFTASMLRAFFWIYGEIGLIGNAIKIIIDFIWAYLLIRLIRGGG